MTYSDALTAALAALHLTGEVIVYNSDHGLEAIMVYDPRKTGGPVVYVTSFGGDIPESAADAVAVLEPAGESDFPGSDAVDGAEVSLSGDVTEHAWVISNAISAQTRPRPRYVGLWHGGAGYSSGYWATDALAFTSLDHAREFFAARRDNANTPSTRVVEWTVGARAVAGTFDDGLQTPGVGDDSSLILAPWSTARLDSLDADGPYAASHVLTFGPRGGIRVND